jgi:hypothetical protein
VPVILSLGWSLVCSKRDSTYFISHGFSRGPGVGIRILNAVSEYRASPDDASQLRECGRQCSSHHPETIEDWRARPGAIRSSSQPLAVSSHEQGKVDDPPFLTV